MDYLQHRREEYKKSKVCLATMSVNWNFGHLLCTALGKLTPFTTLCVLSSLPPHA